MRRSGFASKFTPRPVREWTGPAPSPRKPVVAMLVAPRRIVAVPKDRPERSEAYRRLVAALPCINCQIVGFSQAAHGPTLGARIKSNDTDCFPLCCARPDASGCHYLFDTYQLFDREARAAWAKKWARQTRAALARIQETKA